MSFKKLRTSRQNNDLKKGNVVGERILFFTNSFQKADCVLQLNYLHMILCKYQLLEKEALDLKL